MIKKLKSFWRIVVSISLYKTLIFNFKALHFKKAIKIPFLVGRCVSLIKVGRIELEYKGHHRIHIGSLDMFNTTCTMRSIWNNCGKIIIRGRIILQPSFIIYVSKNGTLVFDGENRIGARTQILCDKFISFGSHTGVSWDCQISDSDFHFIRNMATGEIKPISKPIRIGQNVWIGNHVIIGKGVSVANGSICGMNSMIIKSLDMENRIYIGSPAKPLDGSYERIFDRIEEAKIRINIV